MRFAVLFPLACSIAGFVLAMLCLFAGHKPGFMEDYDIVRVSTRVGDFAMPFLFHIFVPTSACSSDGL